MATQVIETEVSPEDFELHSAARSGDEAKVAHLLTLPDAESRMKRRDPHERTPLHLACHGNHAKVVSQLISSGASLNATAKAGFGALHFACQAGSVDALKVMLDGGAKSNVWEARKKNTPLHLAALKGDAACVTLLLRAGADPLAKTKKGETPFDLGKAHEAVGTALRAHLEELQKGYSVQSSAIGAAESTSLALEVNGAEELAAVVDANATPDQIQEAQAAAQATIADTTVPEPKEIKKQVEIHHCANEEIPSATQSGAEAEPAKKKRKKEKKPKGTLSLSHLENDDGLF